MYFVYDHIKHLCLWTETRRTQKKKQTLFACFLFACFVVELRGLKGFRCRAGFCCLACYLVRNSRNGHHTVFFWDFPLCKALQLRDSHTTGCDKLKNRLRFLQCDVRQKSEGVEFHSTELTDFKARRGRS